MLQKVLKNAIVDTTFAKLTPKSSSSTSLTHTNIKVNSNTSLRSVFPASKVQSYLENSQKSKPNITLGTLEQWWYSLVQSTSSTTSL